jgi:soluble lytic murein transglycosylase
MGDRVAATDRFHLTATDYLNSYYGRLAWRQLEQRSEASVTAGVRRQAVLPPAPPPNARRIGRLIELGLYRPALNEVQYAQKVWGDSAPLQATLALMQNRLGNLRAGINAMKRAYPQYLAAGGEELPVEILHVIYPVDYFPLLKGQAQARGLDPYLIAALVAQESNFDAGIRSSANAVGLMQVLPSTGRRYARKMSIRSFSERSLTNPEINVLIGTQYFTDLINRFGAPYFALASYNAGESRVQRWLNEAPTLPEDEFVDNIPFPETQNYVKRILGTAEDYRRLYGEGARVPTVTRPAAKKSTTVTPKRTPAKRTPAKPAAKTPAKKRPAKH